MSETRPSGDSKNRTRIPPCGIFSIEGADRPGQAERLRKAIKGMPGVPGIEINYSTRRR
jgi:hypothetical protein